MQRKKSPKKEAFNRVVGNTGFEPVTSCLSSKRSKPTELIAHIIWDYKCSLISNNFFMKKRNYDIFLIGVISFSN